MSILVTGGAGYIGSHTCVELLQKGYDVIVADNYSNSKPEALKRVKQIVGKEPVFYECDVRDRNGLRRIFAENKIDCVIHFAGLKAVGESCEIPLTYYDNNLNSTIVLCETMAEAGVKRLIFSSSATVYGENQVPYREDMPTGEVTNPYGRSKYINEEILKDLYSSDPSWSIILLRYFNPVGAHESGLIGEDPCGIPNNLMPYITQVAIGKRPFLRVFGNDYNTPDGTGVRDFIHVTDLAKGHVNAVKKATDGNGLHIYNLGTGNGYSVLDMVAAFEKASGKEIPYEICPRREGDIAICYADPTLAFCELQWKAERGLDQMCEDSWRWQMQNPKGYEE